MSDGIEFGEDAPNVKHHRLAAGSQANTGMPSLEKREPKLVLKPANAAADRRCIESERFSGTTEVSGVRRGHQVLEITNLHGLRPWTSAP
jgi:hypothetical protein